MMPLFRPSAPFSPNWLAVCVQTEHPCAQVLVRGSNTLNTSSAANFLIFFSVECGSKITYNSAKRGAAYLKLKFQEIDGTKRNRLYCTACVRLALLGSSRKLMI